MTGLGTKRTAWLAIHTWGIAAVLFAWVQLLRPRYLAFIRSCDVAIDSGLIPWTEPAPTGPHLAGLYRVMHNLTVPYVMGLYVVLFLLLFLGLKKSRFATASWATPACLFAHSLFMGLYVLALHLVEIGLS